MDRSTLHRDKGVLILQGLLGELQAILADAQQSAFHSQTIQGHFAPLIELIEEFVRGCIENIEQFLAQQKRNSRTKKELNRMCALMEKEIKRWEIKKTARPADVKEIETLRRNTQDVIDILKLKVASAKKIEVSADYRGIETALRQHLQIFVGGKDICVKPLGSNQGESLSSQAELSVSQLGRHLQHSIVHSSRQAEWKMEQRDRQRALQRQSLGLSMIRGHKDSNAFRRSTTMSPAHRADSAYSSQAGFNPQDRAIRLEPSIGSDVNQSLPPDLATIQSNTSLSVRPPQRQYLSAITPLRKAPVPNKQVSFQIEGRRVSHSSQHSRGSTPVGGPRDAATPPSTAPPHSRGNIHNSSGPLHSQQMDPAHSPIPRITTSLPNPFQLSEQVLIQPVEGKAEVVLFDVQKMVSRTEDTHIKFPFAFGFTQVRDLAFVCGGRVGHPFTGMALATNFALRKNCNILMLKSMYYSRGGLAATSLRNRFIYATGGSNKEYLSVCERYDINTNNWESLPSLTECRGYHTVTSIQNKFLYAFCGWNGIDDLASVERYQWGADQWETVELVGISPLWRKRSYISSLSMLGPGPQTERGGVGVAEESENQILVFGKNNGNNATFVLDTNADGLVRIASVVLGGELPNSYYGSCCVRYDERIFTVDDKFAVWEYAGSNWKKLSFE